MSCYGGAGVIFWGEAVVVVCRGMQMWIQSGCPIVCHAGSSSIIQGLSPPLAAANGYGGVCSYRLRGWGAVGLVEGLPLEDPPPPSSSAADERRRL